MSQPIPFHLTLESSAYSLAAFLPYGPTANLIGKRATRIQLMRQATVDVRHAMISSTKTDIWRVDNIGEASFAHAVRSLRGRNLSLELMLRRVIGRRAHVGRVQWEDKDRGFGQGGSVQGGRAEHQRLYPVHVLTCRPGKVSVCAAQAGGARAADDGRLDGGRDGYGGEPNEWVRMLDTVDARGCRVCSGGTWSICYVIEGGLSHYPTVQKARS